MNVIVHMTGTLIFAVWAYAVSLAYGDQLYGVIHMALEGIVP